MPPKRTDDSPVFQLKVTLNGSQPPIWRRLLVRGSTTLYKMDVVIQIAMGWTNSHLHLFHVDGVMYGEPSPEWDARDERRVKLGQIVPQVGDWFVYEYDMGDGWQHAIVVEKVLPAEPGVRYPLCVAGERACPPEDVGGVWGYEGFLEAIRDPKHPEHEDMLDWIGGEFDPEAFDLAAINHYLSQLR
ncbi:MAG: plasmid pRiA4b ORF-3 family protein [Anaerolineae bacterium]|nr:plasmid pRiA4b ORF-3 family protein [Anaerolineae bacterium]